MHKTDMRQATSDKLPATSYRRQVTGDKLPATSYPSASAVSPSASAASPSASSACAASPICEIKFLSPKARTQPLNVITWRHVQFGCWFHHQLVIIFKIRCWCQCHIFYSVSGIKTRIYE